MVVDSPPYVPLAGVDPVGPPGVLPGLARVKMPEGIYETGGGIGIHPGTFFGQVTGVPLVLFGPGKVYRGVGYVVVSGKDKMPFLFPVLFAEFQYGVAEAEFVVQPFGGILGIGEVCRYDGEIPEIRLKHPPLVIKFANAKGF